MLVAKRAFPYISCSFDIVVKPLLSFSISDRMCGRAERCCCCCCRFALSERR